MTERVRPGPGQESVWDYPRPPSLVADARRVRVVHRGVVIADTRRGLRLLETSHPPTWYLPPEDVALERLRASAGESFCEWKGVAGYHDVVVADEVVARGVVVPSAHGALRRAREAPRLLREPPRRVLGGRATRRPAAGRVLRRMDHARRGGAVQGRPGHDGVVTAFDGSVA
jgi:uncharacterized protein (DUF427 family)